MIIILIYLHFFFFFFFFFLLAEIWTCNLCNLTGHVTPLYWKGFLFDLIQKFCFLMI